jgi:soluble lytic murein transglycosylase-like protein
MARKNRNARTTPQATSIEYDVKKDKMVCRTVLPEKPAWITHLAIFLGGIVVGAFMMLALCKPAWPADPPRIGKLVMPQEYWDYTLEASLDFQVPAHVIAGVMVIESRFVPDATSGRGRCVGLMQLDRGTARSVGVDPWDPRENIRGGAAVLARLLSKHRGNLRKAIIEYNGTGNPAYLREVLRAIAQAKRN